MGKTVEDCLLREGFPTGAGEELRSPPEEEGASETMCDELTIVHSPYFGVSGGEETSNYRAKLSTG